MESRTSTAHVLVIVRRAISTLNGSFNSLTNAFTGLTWSHGLGGVPGLPGNLSVQFTLNGTAQLAAVPLPAAALLFGSGLAGLLVTRARTLLA